MHSSEQLLEQLLGEDIARVEVLTADKLVMRVLGDTGMSIQILKEATLQRLLTQAIAQTAFDGTPEQQLTQQQTIARMSLGYLQDEFDKIIVSRQISTLKEYLSAPRTGRKMRFTPLQRRAIWAIYATLRQLLSQQHDLSWSQARAMAAQAIAESRLAATYDAVIIDEAQDLEPSVLNLLVQLACRCIPDEKVRRAI